MARRACQDRVHRLAREPDLKRLLLIALASLGALVIAAAGLLWLGVEIALAPATVAETLARASGRAVMLGARPRLVLGFSPRLVLTDVALADAPWGGPEPMLRAERIAAEAALAPLLRGVVRLERLEVRGADVLLAQGPDGDGNWELAAADGESESAFALAENLTVEVSETRLRYRARPEGRILSLRLDALAVRGDGGGYALKGSGGLGGAPLAAEGRLALADDGLGLDLEAALAGARLTLAGRLGAATDLSIAASGEDVAALARLLGPAPPLAAAFEGRGRLVAAGAEAPRLEALALTLHGDAGARVTVAGVIGDLATARSLDLGVAAEGATLASLAAMLGGTAPAIGPVTARSRLRDQADGYRLEGLEASLGEGRIEGDLALALGGARPRLSGRLSAHDLALDALMPAAGEAPAEEGRVFSVSPLPFAILRAFDLDLDLAAEGARLGGLSVGVGAGRAVLEEGRLELALAPLVYRQREVRVALVADARLAVPEVSLEVSGDDLDLGALLADLRLSDAVSLRGRVALALEGRGPSPHRLAASAEGTVAVVSGAGVIRSAYLDFAAADLLQALLPLGEDAADARVRCAVAAFTVAEGVARAQALLFDTERMTVRGAGSVDLGREHFDLVLDPKPKKPALLSLATRVRVRGQLAAPEILPDARDLALGIAGALAGAVATGGIGVILPFLSAGAGADNPCLAAMAVAPPEAPAPAPAAPPPAEAPTAQGAGVLERMDRAIQGFFGGAPDQSSSSPVSRGEK